MECAYRVSKRLEGALLGSIKVAALLNDTVSIRKAQTGRGIISQMLTC
jgi:hypothetical protein